MKTQPDRLGERTLLEDAQHLNTLLRLWDMTGNMQADGYYQAGAPQSPWLLGQGTALDLDLTGTDYDTNAEMLAAGVALSDAHSPFPSNLYQPVSGSWSHSAGNGWQPAAPTTREGPGMIIPLARPGDWSISIDLDLTSATASRKDNCVLGYAASSNHYGAFAFIAGATDSAIRYNAELYTNDGDDTITKQYDGADVTGAGVYTIKLRNYHGAISVWDDQDDAWHNYEGRQSTGIAYTAAYVFVQIYKHPDTVISDQYLSNIKLEYL